MLVIRLTKVGKRGDPNFRIVVNDKRRSAKAGKYVEMVGSHNPALKKTNLNKERVLYWISKGAKPSATVHNLLVKGGVISGKKIPKHKTKKAEETKKEETAKT